MSVQVILQIDHRGVGGATLTLQEPAHVSDDGPYGPYGPYGPAGSCRELLVQWKNRHPLLITAPAGLPLAGNEFHLYPFWKSPVGRETGDSPIAMGRRESDPLCRLCVIPSQVTYPLECQILWIGRGYCQAEGETAAFRFSADNGASWSSEVQQDAPGTEWVAALQSIYPAATVVHRDSVVSAAPFEECMPIGWLTLVSISYPSLIVRPTLLIEQVTSPANLISINGTNATKVRAADAATRNEIQLVHCPENCHHTLTLAGSTTAEISPDDLTITIQSKLEAITAPGAVSVLRPLGPVSLYVIEFLGEFGGQDLPQLTSDHAEVITILDGEPTA